MTALDRAAALADTLARTTAPVDPAWLAAIRGVPRHELLPRFLAKDTFGRWRAVIDDGTPERWLAAVYDDRELVILADPSETALSCTTTPSQAIRLLTSLDVHDRHRVLHVGTGSGYLEALLCHRVGDDRVSGVDVQPDLIPLAQARLAALGYTPDLRVGDGRDGAPDRARFDRILATCAFTSIPPAWLRQLTPGGVIVAPVTVAPFAGNVVRLTRLDDERVEGRFAATYDQFVPSRRDPDEPDQPDAWTNSARRPRPWRTSGIGAKTIQNPETAVVWFLAALTFGAHAPDTDWQFHTEKPCAGLLPSILLTAPDGSWADIAIRAHAGVYAVSEGGPRRLWLLVERAHELWIDLGRPGWDRFGLTVTPEDHTLWFDRPDSELRWTRPTGNADRAWTRAGAEHRTPSSPDRSRATNART